jgi:two-component system, chemotaxis family, chemotaxis protein CheY
MAPRKILAVDDSKTMRDMVTFTLRKAGFEVMEASDGQNALDVMRGTRFDLIITDINMPIMDGITLIKNVRGASDHRGVPILILTTESDDAKKAAGKSAGATGWLVKPFSPDKLVDLVHRVCP